jgi:hypothetical protein
MGPTRFELAAKPTEKQEMTEKRGTESGTVGGDSGFGEAVAAIMQLPLSDSEKAEAVRRLLR